MQNPPRPVPRRLHQGASRDPEPRALVRGPLEHGERVRLGVEHPLVEREQRVVGEEQEQVLERLREEEAGA
jgi:hypothetical protein